MKKYSFFLLFLLFSLFIAGLSYAESPVELSGLQPLAPNSVFSTFSAQSLDEGKSAFAVSAEKTTEPSFYRFSAHLGYGIVNGIEVSLSAPYVIEQRDMNGLEDTSIGLKHRFLREGKYNPSMAYILMASLFTGKEEFSSDGHVGGGLALSKKVGPVHGHANFLYDTPGRAGLKDRMTFSTGIDFSAAHNFRILGELYGRKSYYSSNVDQMELRFGYRLLADDETFITLGVGIDLKDSAPQYRILLSLTALFPREKKVIEKVYEEVR